MSARLRLVERHDEIEIAAHRNQFAQRQSHLPPDYFREPLGARIERWGNRAVGVAMSLVAIFLVLGLAFGWFR